MAPKKKKGKGDGKKGAAAANKVENQRLGLVPNPPKGEMLLTVKARVALLGQDDLAAHGVSKATVMMEAAAGGTPSWEQMLERKADVNAQDMDGCALLPPPMLVSQTPLVGTDISLRMIRRPPLILDSPAGGHSCLVVNDTGTALMFAASSAQLPCVLALLRKGADVSIADKYGYTATALASRLGYIDIVDALTNPVRDHGFR